MDRYEYSSRDELRVQPLMTTADDGCDQGESSLTHDEEDEAGNLDVRKLTPEITWFMNPLGFFFLIII
jgi:hypothetical protein